MNKQQLVLVGNGMAGVRFVEEVLKNDPDGFAITIFGSEPHVNYNRILLSAVLQGRASFDDITLHDRDWYEKQGIRLFTGETAVSIDSGKKAIRTDTNREVPYDKLVIATGSVPFLLPLPGADKEGIVTFRTIEDCQKIMKISKQYKKAVVIGGGILGLEAASGLLNRGMEVSVVHNSGHVMEKQLDPMAAMLLQKELESQGIRLYLQTETQEIIGDSRVEGLRFTDGTELKADLVVMAVGVRPNVQLARESGIETNRGIVVNDYLETNAPDVYAVGECAEHRGIVYGLVKPLYEQGKVLADRLCGVECRGYEGSVLSTQLKVAGVEVFSAGRLHQDETTKAITIYDETTAVYNKVIFQDKKIIGAVLFGDTRDAARLLDMIAKQTDVSEVKQAVLFPSVDGQVYQAASLGQSEMVCNCNSVTKGAIIEAVQREGLTTVEQVKASTKASGSCGGCKPLVAELLAYIQSEAFSEAIEHEPMCACTALTEEEVVREMQLQGLASVQEVMDALEWESRLGCSICRPALHYYLTMMYPEYESKQENLVESERMSAILQHDGRYTVIPQMYGGMTTPEQLRKIADAAEKYNCSVAATSEQRIHLMGIRKENLAGVWADLNMQLSAPYGNRVQHVKTCIGEHVCQCPKQSSLQLAVSLDKRLECLPTPHRFTIGVSACLHNGAGSTTKDIGVIGTDWGWEIYAGGSSGRSARAGVLLCVAGSHEEACEIISGFVHYYRETAHFRERSWQWMERLGLIHIREVLFDAELRQQLLERLDSEAFRKKGVLENSYA